MTFEEYAISHDQSRTGGKVMTFNEWALEHYGCDPAYFPESADAKAAWDAGYHQAIQDIIDYAEHMGDVEKFARQHGIRVEEE